MSKTAPPQQQQGVQAMPAQGQGYGPPGQYGMQPMWMPMPMYYGPMGYNPMGGSPGMMNPFGMSPYAIPQLDGVQGMQQNMMGAGQNNQVKPSYTMAQPKREPQTKDEYIERFNREVYPTLGRDRLLKLQATVRGWYTRRVIVPRKRMYYALLEDYVAKKVDEFIQDTIVPDIVLEVINENATKRDYNLYSANFKGEIKYVEELVGRVVNRLAKEAVQETVSGITGDYMRRKQDTKIVSKDPIELLMFDFLENFCRKEAEQVTNDAVSEMTDEYIVESQFITFFRRKLLRDRVKQVMKEAVDELLCEHFVNVAIERILEGFVEPLALLCVEEEFFDKEAEEIDKGFDDFVMRNIMDVVLGNINERLEDKNLEFIADQATRYNKFKDFSEEFLNEVMMFDDQ